MQWTQLPAKRKSSSLNNEDDNGYYRIPAADQSIGHLTLFEFNELKRKAQERSGKTGRRVSEREILMAYDELHEYIETTKEKTKKAKIGAIDEQIPTPFRYNRRSGGL